MTTWKEVKFPQRLEAIQALVHKSSRDFVEKLVY